jgi:hypothetical protein
VFKNRYSRKVGRQAGSGFRGTGNVVCGEGCGTVYCSQLC